MPRTMRYTDGRGRKQTLTSEQRVYLDTAARGFDKGWGGLSSTQTVRLLHERGLILLDDLLYRDRGWRVLGRTKLGDQLIEQWNALRDAHLHPTTPTTPTAPTPTETP